MPRIRKLLKLGIEDSRYRMLGLLCGNRRIMSDKEHAHELIDQLPPPQLSAVVGLLEAPSLTPFDGEPVMAEEEKALADTVDFHDRGFSDRSISEA